MVIFTFVLTACDLDIEQGGGGERSLDKRLDVGGQCSVFGVAKCLAECGIRIAFHEQCHGLTSIFG